MSASRTLLVALLALASAMSSLTAAEPPAVAPAAVAPAPPAPAKDATPAVPHMSALPLDDRILVRVDDRMFTTYRFGAGQK